jgi:hypothetical protein
LLGVSLSPCCRSHPARVVRRVSQSATAHAAFAFPVAGSASGAAHFRGHLCVRLRYSLETRHHPADGVVERLQEVGFPSPCSPSYRALAFPLVGFPPTEHASLSWTHHRPCGFHRLRRSTFGHSPWSSMKHPFPFRWPSQQRFIRASSHCANRHESASREQLGWVGARRVTLRYVSSHPPFSTGRAPFKASGSAPPIHSPSNS